MTRTRIPRLPSRRPDSNSPEKLRQVARPPHLPSLAPRKRKEPLEEMPETPRSHQESLLNHTHLTGAREPEEGKLKHRSSAIIGLGLSRISCEFGKMKSERRTRRGEREKTTTEPLKTTEPLLMLMVWRRLAMRRKW